MTLAILPLLFVNVVPFVQNRIELVMTYVNTNTVLWMPIWFVGLAWFKTTSGKKQRCWTLGIVYQCACISVCVYENIWECHCLLYRLTHQFLFPATLNIIWAQTVVHSPNLAPAVFTLSRFSYNGQESTRTRTSWHWSPHHIFRGLAKGPDRRVVRNANSVRDFHHQPSCSLSQAHPGHIDSESHCSVHEVWCCLVTREMCSVQ